MFVSVRNGTMTLLGAFLLICLGFTPARATETLLHSFDTNYVNGAYPVGQLTLSGSTFYGVTEYGVNGYGNVFTMTTTGLVKTIHEFTGGTGDGSYPNSGLVAAGGNFYGTTLYGGSVANVGVVYEITPKGTVTILHSFTGYNATTPSQSDGASPYAGLLLASNGKLYGTTYIGGDANQGTVYSIKTDGTGYSIIHNFVSATDLAYRPLTGLAETKTGVLYGACNAYTGFYGGLYKLNKDGSGFTTVQGFSATAPNGYNPSSDLVEATDGNLYGFCANGGSFGYGTVFKIVPGATDTVTTLWNFDGYTGASPTWSNAGYYPQNRLLASGSNLYGVTRQGGAHGYGTAFELTLAGVCTRLTSFNVNDANGSANPLALSGSTFYATSYWGGTTAVTDGLSGDGAAVSISSAGALKVIQSFYVRDGYQTYGNLVQVGVGAAAAFYGVTYQGGEFGDGVIFKINSAGAFTIIHHLNNSANIYEGATPVGGLLLGRDGFLYGTTTNGGKYGYGTIFKVSTVGALTVIHHFQYYAEGNYPTSALVQGVGKDTNLYGSCYAGGFGYGSIFSTNTTGTAFAVLSFFGGPDGANPAGPLVPDGLGNLYGTTYVGGAHNLGTIFKVSTSGATFTKLFDFYLSGGTYPAGYYPYYSGPMVLNGGFLYGVTQNGGANSDGVIFKCNVATGATTSFHDFNNSIGEGYNPYGGLFYDSPSGNFYGTNYTGGTGGYGVVYAVSATTGALTILHSFTGYNAGSPSASDSANPYGGVILGTDGFLYGTTLSGGSANYGTVFKQTP